MTKQISITHHGGQHGVTGSCHQLSLPSGEGLLVDCGLFQGDDAKHVANPADIDFALDNLHALLVTHCHIDHVGRIPYLLAKGWDKPIYATDATAALLPLVIEDAVKIGISSDKSLIKAVSDKLKQLLRPMPYKQWFSIDGMPNTKCKFQVAGHILGSAYIECDVAKTRVVFSGDLGAPYSPLLPAPKSPYKADVLVLESTYGDKCHQGRKQRQQQLQAVIERCLNNNGTVLIPAFSIGRTQELLYELEDIIYRQSRKAKHSCWENIDIILDSPLAADFTQHYRHLSAHWDKEAKSKLKRGRHPLNFEQLITVDDHNQHIRLVNHLAQSQRPAIVIAASGMCNGGRITQYLTALLPLASTEVLFVGYQAQGSVGRSIQHYGPKGGYVFINDEKIEIKAAVHTISGYSAHADQKNLVNFVKRIRLKPTDIRLVHGDDKAKQRLYAALQGIH